ncbi:hypothetical protein Agub_g3868, partial [Astrephomene gubernaculifera]
DSVLGAIQSADSTLVGGVTLAAVLALLIRSLVAITSYILDRNDRAANGPNGPFNDSSDGNRSYSGIDDESINLFPLDASSSSSSSGGGGSRRSGGGGVPALAAAAALNNDPRAILVDIRSPTDIKAQGVPDLRPFRRGQGATYTSLPFPASASTSNSSSTSTSASTQSAPAAGAAATAITAL